MSVQSPALSDGLQFYSKGLVLGNIMKFCVPIPMSLLENTGKYLCDCQNPFGFSGTNTSKANISQILESQAAM